MGASFRKVMVLLVCCLVTLLLGYCVDIKTLYGDLGRTEKAADMLHHDHAKQNQLIAKLGQYEKQANGLRNKLKGCASLDVFGVARTGRDTGISLRTLRPYKKSCLDITAVGDYGRLVRFVNAITAVQCCSQFNTLSIERSSESLGRELGLKMRVCYLC